MSHRSYYFLARSSRVYIPEPAFYITNMEHLTVFQVQVRSIQIPTAM